MKMIHAGKITKKDSFLIIPIFKNDQKEKYSEEINFLIKSQCASKDFEGKEGETNLFYLRQKVLLLGLGDKKKFNGKKAREIFATAVRKAKSHKTQSVTIWVIKDLEEYGQEIGEGLEMGNYTFAKFKTGKKAKEIGGKDIKEIRTVNGKLNGLEKGMGIASSVNYVRDLVVGPPNIITATYLAKEAQKIAKKNNYKIQVFDRKKIERLKMGGIMAVNSGSQKDDQQARFVIIEHNGGKKNEAPVVLVGKGLVFDSGGLNLKPGRAIQDMQQDMAGGAVVFGVFSLLKKLKIKKNVVGLVPITENLIDAYSFRPNDILTSYSGKTIEVLNTDAEGRLIIADALAYGVKHFKPKYIIDIATLTGACVVALGDRYAGLFSNDDSLAEKLEKAGKGTDELVWRMPIHKDHSKTMESGIADLRNVENSSNASSCTAAAFLKNFVDKAKWAHLDIAGTAFTSNPKKYETEKATGYGVRLLLKFLEN